MTVSESVTTADTGSISVLESAIYALLGGHLPALARTRLLHQWSDKVWAIVRLSHERDCALLHSAHRRARAFQSSIYAGTDATEPSYDAAMVSWLAVSLPGYEDLSHCRGVFDAVPAPLTRRLAAAGRRESSNVAAETSTNETLTCDNLFLSLQAAMAQGTTVLAAHISSVTLHVLAAFFSCPSSARVVDSTDTFTSVSSLVGCFDESSPVISPRSRLLEELMPTTPSFHGGALLGMHKISNSSHTLGKSFMGSFRALRCYAHLLLLLRVSGAPELCALVTDDCFVVSVGAYVQHLQHERQVKLHPGVNVVTDALILNIKGIPSIP